MTHQTLTDRALAVERSRPGLRWPSSERHPQLVILELRSAWLEADQNPRQNQVALVGTDLDHQLIADLRQRDVALLGERQRQPQLIAAVQLLDLLSAAPPEDSGWVIVAVKGVRQLAQSLEADDL